MENPLVSVILPVFDDDSFLQAALDSLVNQTYSYLEIILLLDSSKNKSAALLDIYKKKFAEKNIRTREIFFEGQTMIEALNQAATSASGKYITFLPSIDTYHPQRIETLVADCQNHDFSILFTRINAVDEHSQNLCFDHDFKKTYEKSIFNILDFPTIECNFLIANIAATFGNLFLKQEVFKKTQGFNISANHFCLEFILRAMQSFDVHFLNQNLYNFRLLSRIDKQISFRTFEKQLELDTIKEANDFLVPYFSSADQDLFTNVNAPSRKNWSYFYEQIQKKYKLKNYFHTFIQKDSLQNTLNPIVEELDVYKEIISSHETVTLVTHDLEISGGAPKLILDLSYALKKAQVKVNVIALKDGLLKKEFEKLEIPIKIPHSFFFKWNTKGSKLFRGFCLIAANLYFRFQTGSKVIINSSASYKCALPLALFSKNKKIYWYIHESFSPAVFLDEGLTAKLLKRAVHRFSFWFGSKSTKEIWESAVNIPSTEGKVLYWSGLNVKASREIKQPIKQILAMGLSSPRKGFHFLIDAFIACVEENLIDPDVQLTIVGFPKEIDEFNKKIILQSNKKNIASRIKLIECIDPTRVDFYFQQADLFIQPSVLECLPLSLLQAMSMDIPVITTDVNGCKEAIRHEQTGLLCKPFNLKSLKENIVQATQLPEKTRMLAMNAKNEFKEKFSLKNNLKDIIEELQLKKE